MTSLAEQLKVDQKTEDALRRDWAMGNYTSDSCPNCNRQRLCVCTNGKTRCEKCNWVVEDSDYCPLPPT